METLGISSRPDGSPLLDRSQRLTVDPGRHRPDPDREHDPLDTHTIRILFVVTGTPTVSGGMRKETDRHDPDATDSGARCSDRSRSRRHDDGRGSTRGRASRAHRADRDKSLRSRRRSYLGTRRSRPRSCSQLSDSQQARCNPTRVDVQQDRDISARNKLRQDDGDGAAQVHRQVARNGQRVHQHQASDPGLVQVLSRRKEPHFLAALECEPVWSMLLDRGIRSIEIRLGLPESFRRPDEVPLRLPLPPSGRLLAVTSAKGASRGILPLALSWRVDSFGRSMLNKRGADRAAARVPRTGHA